MIMKKQLEFEKRRVYITDTEETEQFISSGSSFNFYYLLNKNQPAIVPGKIKTSYEYISIFEIAKGNEQISNLRKMQN